MTPKQCLAVLLRRWYVVALVLILTAAGVALLPRDEGVYWARSTVVFVLPENPKRPGNVLEGSDLSLVYFAAAIEREMNGGRRQVQLSSATATLYGVGVRSGYTVTLPNSGGQWRTNFNRPMLVVEVVESTQDRAQTLLDTVLTQVQTLAQQRQLEAGAAPKDLIRTQLSPENAPISHVTGSSKRAAAALGLLGLGVALASALSVDRVARARVAARAR